MKPAASPVTAPASPARRRSGDKGRLGSAHRAGQGRRSTSTRIEGYNGKTGVMPAKGGRADWPDDLVKQAVDHMVELNQ